MKLVALCLAISSTPFYAHSSEIKFPNRVTIKWQSLDNDLFYSPSKNFLPGKQVSKKILDSEIKKYCTRHFGFTNVTVFSASDRNFGSSNTKNSKFLNSYRFISGGWILDEYGEETFKLKYRCSGSMSVLVKSRSAGYRFRIENLQTRFTGNDSDFFDAGMFPLEALEKAKWNLSAVFPENWRIADSAITFPEWTPSPPRYWMED